MGKSIGKTTSPNMDSVSVYRNGVLSDSRSVAAQKISFVTLFTSYLCGEAETLY